MVEIFDGSLNAALIADRWRAETACKNMGALALFIGIAREENGVSALSFDIYRPILDRWFADREKDAARKNAVLFMAHSKGDVPARECSFIAGAASRNRRAALETIDLFVEDFKKNAPIWKFDIINGDRVFAADRAIMLPRSGILARRANR